MNSVEPRASRNSPRRAIVIAGMHRSGTSALTRVLNLLGCDLPTRLLETDPTDQRETNVSGFWEAVDIRAINDRFVERLGLRWHSVAPMPKDAFRSDAAAEARASISTFLANEMKDGRPLLIKDPRISRMIPVWIDALTAADVTPFFLISVRSPAEIARSLHHRNAIRPEYSFLLWLRHYVEAEAMSRGFARVFLSYDSLVCDWRSVIDGLFHRLGLPAPPRSDDTDVAIDNFIRRGAADVSKVSDNGVAPELVQDVYRLLLAASEGRTFDVDAMDDHVREVVRADQVHSFFLNAATHARFTLAADLPPTDRVMAMDEFEGRRVTTPGSGVVWFVMNGHRRFIPSAQVYDALFGSLDVQDVDDLDHIPRGQDLGDGTCLVQTDTATDVYLVTSSVQDGISKHLILDYDTFCDFGLNMATVKQVPSLLMQAIPWGVELRRPTSRC